MTDLHTWVAIFRHRLTTVMVHRQLLPCKHRAIHQTTHLTRAILTHPQLSALQPTTLLQLPRQQLQPHLRPKLKPARSRYQLLFQSPNSPSLRRTNVKIPSKAQASSSLPRSRHPRRKHSLAHNRKRQLRLQPHRPPLPPRALDRPSPASTRCSPQARTVSHLFAPAAGAQAAVVWHLTSPCTS